MTTRWNDSLQAVNDQFEICIFGAEKTGKSSFILHFVKGYFIEEIDSCVEELYTKIIPNETGYREYTILDTNTSEVDYYASSRRKQIQNTLSMVFVYAVNDRDSFEALEDIYQRIKSIREDMPPVIVVGLKSDIYNDIQVEYYEGREFSERIDAINFTECSAKLNIGVDKTFEPLIIEIERVKEMEALQKADSASVFSSRSMEDSQEQIEETEQINVTKTIKNEADEGLIDKDSKHFSDKESKISKDDRGSYSRREIRTITRNISDHKSVKEKENTSKCCIII